MLRKEEVVKNSGAPNEIVREFARTQSIVEDEPIEDYDDDYPEEVEQQIQIARVIPGGRSGFQDVVKDKSYSCQWVQEGSHYIPMTKTVNELPCGYYRPQENVYKEQIYLEKRDVLTPELYHLPNKVHEMVMNDIGHFWKSEERYKRFKNVYKRNILIYSIPGNGKTSLINLLAQDLIKEYNGIIVTIENERELLLYSKIMNEFRHVEPDRKVITIIEDFERLAKNEQYTALLLQILDGNEQFDKMVTIATTNYPEQLEKRFTCRPSRFNLVIEYIKPDEDVRRFYITSKLRDSGIDVEDEKVKQDIERYVGLSKGFTFDFMKEMIQGIYVDEIPEEEMVNRINAVIKSDGKYQTSEDQPKTIGFGSKK